MKSLGSIISVVLATFLLIGFAGTALGEEIFVKETAFTTERTGMVPGEILVKFKAGTSRAEKAALHAGLGAREVALSQYADFSRIKIPLNRSVAEMVAIYGGNPNVEYAEPNFIARALWTPNDPYYSQYQWHLYNPANGGINMEAAWDLSSGDPSVTVAVVDTGVAYEDYQEYVPLNKRRGTWITYQKAPDLANTTFVPGYDFINSDDHPNDDEGHGTHVTGTIAQSTNNGLGVAGIAFNTSIMPVKVLDSGGSGSYAAIAEGIIFAAENGADVISMSLGGSSPSITLENALASAHALGVTIVCASGNDGSATTISYPAAYDAYCIAVGATRYDGAVAPYSNRGASLDLTAPGGDTTIDQNGDGYGDGVLQQTFGTSPTDFAYYFYQGTSMATPHVSGIAALLLAQDPSRTPDAIREILQSTAEDKGSPGWDPDYGWGIVDAAAALSYTAGANSAPVADAGGDQAVLVNQQVNFDGSGSYDPGGEIVSYDWDFGDGATATGVAAGHSYPVAGSYTVTLTVTDNGGLTDVDSGAVTVSELSVDIALTANIDMNLATRQAGKNLFVNALASVAMTDEGVPVEGVTLYGVWSDSPSVVVTGVTDTAGVANFTSAEIKSPASATLFTFTLVEVAKAGYSSVPTGETTDSISFGP